METHEEPAGRAAPQPTEPDPAPRKRPRRRSAAGADRPSDAALYLTVEQTRLALALSRRKVEMEIAAGKLPVYRFGRTIRIRREDLERYEAEHRGG